MVNEVYKLKVNRVSAKIAKNRSTRPDDKPIDSFGWNWDRLVNQTVGLNFGYRKNVLWMQKEDCGPFLQEQSRFQIFFFFLNGEISDFYRAIKLMSQTTILREEYMILWERIYKMSMLVKYFKEPMCLCQVS